MGRHDLQNEGEREENPTAPPADPRQKISSLANADQGVWRGARSAEARGQATTLSALKKNRCNDDEAVDYEKRQKKRVNH